MFKFTCAYQKGTQKWQKSKYYIIKCTRKNDASRAKYYIHFHSLCVTHMHMKVCPTCQPAIMWWAASTLCGFISFKFLRPIRTHSALNSAKHLNWQITKLQQALRLSTTLLSLGVDAKIVIVLCVNGPLAPDWPKYKIVMTYHESVLIWTIQSLQSKIRNLNVFSNISHIIFFQDQTCNELTYFWII